VRGLKDNSWQYFQLLFIHDTYTCTAVCRELLKG